MVDLQRLGIVDHIGKNYMFLSFIKFIDSFDGSYFLLVFRTDTPPLQFGPEDDPADIYDDADDINGDPYTCILHDVAVDFTGPDYDIGHPCVDPPEKQNRIGSCTAQI